MMMSGLPGAGQCDVYVADWRWWKCLRGVLVKGSAAQCRAAGSSASISALHTELRRPPPVPAFTGAPGSAGAVSHCRRKTRKHEHIHPETVHFVFCAAVTLINTEQIQFCLYVYLYRRDNTPVMIPTGAKQKQLMALASRQHVTWQAGLK